MKKKRLVSKIALFLVLALVLGFVGTNAVVYAASASNGTQIEHFEMQIEQTNGWDSDMAKYQVTVTNNGDDVNGVVRVLFETRAGGKLAVDTVISLPARSTKQFTVEAPSGALYTGRSTITLYVLSNHGRILHSSTTNSIFGSGTQTVKMGVLSDSYGTLRQLDAAGAAVEIDYEDKYIEITEMTADNILTDLAGQEILVIDRYDVSSLSADAITAIEDWTYSGGILIVGTGAYYEQTLSGFDPDFLGIEVSQVYLPAKLSHYYEEMKAGVFDENAIPPEDKALLNSLPAVSDANAYPRIQPADISERTQRLNDGFNSFNANMVNFNEMTTVEFSDLAGTNLYELWQSFGYGCSLGRGSVTVLFYSLTDSVENSQVNANYMYNLLEDPYSNIDDYAGTSDAMFYSGKDAFEQMINQGTKLNYVLMCFIVIIYVILAGPIVYIILRCNKCAEWYWMAVPALTVLFVIIVFFAGRGYNVVGTSAYSVSVSDASGVGEKKSYLMAYRAKHKEWNLNVADGFHSAGPVFSDYSGYNSAADDYYYHVITEGDKLSIGAKPTNSFEAVGYTLSGENHESGAFEVSQIDLSNLYSNLGQASGKVKNNSGKNLKYMVVWDNNYLVVVKNVKAGEVVDLSDSKRVCYSGSATYDDSFYYGPVSDAFYDREKAENIQALCAADIGYLQLFDEKTNYVMGVVENYEKVINDECNETSYGCIYTAY